MGVAHIYTYEGWSITVRGNKLLPRIKVYAATTPYEVTICYLDRY